MPASAGFTLAAAHLQEPPGGAPAATELPLLPLAEFEVKRPSPSSQPRSPLTGLENALRVRFGNLDEIELGDLIGKGGEWRGGAGCCGMREGQVRSSGGTPLA